MLTPLRQLPSTNTPRRKLLMEVNRFKNSFSETIFRQKYAQGPGDTWDALCDRLVDDVCGTRGGTLHFLTEPFCKNTGVAVIE